jgi:hypothetical protein
MKMVGFGSSLRKARRSGWEGGYLDYESLKLLSSQIEAVYEETSSNIHQKYHDGVDYRNQLFLESDSDAAFQSVQEETGADRMSDEDDDSHEQLDVETANALVKKKNRTTSFLNNYSHESSSSSNSDQETGNQASAKTSSMGCGGSTSAWPSRSVKPTQHRAALSRDDDFYAPRQGVVQPTSFLVRGDSSENDEDEATDEYVDSMIWAHRTGQMSTETSSLLQQSGRFCCRLRRLSHTGRRFIHYRIKLD